MVDSLSSTERHRWYSEPELVGVVGVAVGVGAVVVLTGFKGEGEGGGCEGLKLESIAANGLLWLSASVAMFVAMVWAGFSISWCWTLRKRGKGGEEEKS